MTEGARLQVAGPHADTEVFYMAGRQLSALGRRLQGSGSAAGAPVCVVSRAGWPYSLAGSHRLAGLAEAACLHARRPALVTGGVGATAITAIKPIAFTSVAVCSTRTQILASQSLERAT